MEKRRGATTSGGQVAILPHKERLAVIRSQPASGLLYCDFFCCLVFKVMGGEFEFGF